MVEPESIKAILATKFDSFEKGERTEFMRLSKFRAQTTSAGPVFQNQAKGVLGTGVFNSDGDMWK